MANRAAHLFARAAEHPDKVALIAEGEPLTFGELAERVRATAGGLARLGIAAGSRVGIMIPTSPEFIIIQQALFALGAIVSPLNSLYRPGEVAHTVQSCDLEHLVMPLAMLDRAPPPGDASVPSLQAIVLTDAQGASAGTLSLAFAIVAGPGLAELAPVANDDVVMLLNTSATTGKSKGVMLTAANLAANYDRTPGWLGLGGGDVILCALPLYNTFGLNQCINAMLVTGATMVLLPRFDASCVVEAIERHGCTFLPAVPTMLQKIVDHPELRPSSLASLSRILVGGAAVSTALLCRVLAVTAPGTEVLTGYGLTEATALVTLAPVRLGKDGEVERGRTIGRVLDGMTLSILREDGIFAGPGEIGEIVVRGPNLMRGYHRAPQDTAAALADGWLHSGDLGYLDQDGYAYIVDRKKDVIIRGGQNIYPVDIEDVLYQVPGVAEAAVVGAPDEVLGEVPVAFVAPVSGAEISTAILLQRCEAELARYKVPAAIYIRRELPKGPTGKILRRELRSAPDTV